MNVHLLKTSMRSGLTPMGRAIFSRNVSSLSVPCLLQKFVVSSPSTTNPSFVLSRRAFSTAEDGKTKSEKTEENGNNANADENFKDEFHEQNYDEPLIAKVFKLIGLTIKLTLVTALVGVVGYAGYTIVGVLLPVGTSSNAIMRKASNLIVENEDVIKAYGRVKTYGVDPGGHAEGRRYYVPEYKYEDPITGEPFHRIKFTVEGDRLNKGTVYTEVDSTTGEFRYIIIVHKDGQRVITVLDRRPPKLSTDERQIRVSDLASEAGWKFYTDSDLDEKQQKKALGPYWGRLELVRCDITPGKCSADGVTNTPAWKIGDKIQPGFKNLDELELAVRPLGLIREGKVKPWWKFW